MTAISRGRAAVPVAGRAAELVREGGGLILVLPLAVWWAVVDGGYRPSLFLAGELYLAGAIAVAAFGLPRSPVSGARAVALAAAAALTAWTALSVLWADDRGAAWLSAERAALYLMAFALPLLWPPSRRVLAGGAVVVVGAAVAALVAGLAASGAAPAELAYTGRLGAPTAYVNATAALWAMGAVLALAVAADPDRRVLVRLAAMGAAGALACGLVLTQSRGAVAVGGVTLAAAFVLTPARLRLLVAAALAIGVVAAALDPLLEVRRLALDGRLDAALERARTLAVVVAAAAAAMGAVWLALERRVRLPAATARRLQAVLRRAAAVGVLAGLIAVAVAADPVGWVQERYEDLKVADYEALGAADSRFTGDLGSNRFDYWRAALEIGSDHPVTGTGAGNFAAPYLLERRVDKAPQYAHSEWLEALSSLGIVGLLALAVFVAAAGVAVVAAWRRRPGQRALVAAASVPAIYLLLHASGDWVAAFPALVVPALALLASALADPAPAAPRGRPIRRRSGAALVAVVLLAVAGSATVMLVSARFTERAWASWRTEPARALSDVRRAQDVDPLSAAPALAEGIIALEVGLPDRARAGFAEAARRDEAAWYPAFQLGLLAGAAGREAEARRWLAFAARRNPREELVAEATAQQRRGRPMDPLAVQREVLSQPG